MARDPNRRCAVPNCGRKCSPALYCRGHLIQRRNGQPFTDLPRPRRRTSDTCLYEGCGRPAESRDHCKSHAEMLRKGIPLHPVGDTAYRSAAARAMWARLTPDQRRERMAGIAGRGRYERSEEWRLRRSRLMAGRRLAFSDDPRECAGCSVAFTPNAPGQLWCTPVCRRRDGQARKFGITRAVLDTLMERQCGGCAICGRTPANGLHLDHDHVTGAARGFLCSTCNTGLGKFQDDPKMLRRAITYLTKPPIR